MRLPILRALIILWISLPAAAGEPRGLVVLVPGTFNSLTPGSVIDNPVSGQLDVNPYFSSAVIDAIESDGYAVYVIKNLAPFGQFEANGARTLEELNNWYSTHFPAGNLPITLLGHSTGGFYSLYLAAHAGTLPIRRVVMVSTPMGGLELADMALSSPLVRGAVNALADGTSGFFDLRGLPELTTDKVSGFLDGIRLAPSIAVYETGGSQSAPLMPWNAWSADYLSPPLVPTAALIGSASDGVVSLSSATDTRAAFAPRSLSSSLTVALDHPRQVLDYRIYCFLGFSNCESIRDEQTRFYSALLNVAR